MPGKGSPQVITRVDPVLKRYLEGYAASHGKTTANLTREVLAEWVYDRVDTTTSGIDRALHRLDVLSKRLQLRVAVLPSAEAKEDSADKVYVAGGLKVPRQKKSVEPEPTAPTERVDTVKQRESVYWVVVDLLRESAKLSENEALASQAKSRMDAMMVVATLARVGEAILEGYDRAYIQPHLDELTMLIDELKEQTKQSHQKGQENAPGRTTT